VTTSDSATLFAHLIRPAGFDATKKYPAIVMIYGGPDAQAVKDAWPGVTLSQALAARGFVIWQMDNRGSAGRGHAFESVIWHRLGAQELADQKEGIRYLVSLGFVDEKRIGMYGWSYGGYMTLYTATHAPGLIRAAIAGGPVADWRNYDSIYTERYMGLPEENAAGYKASAPVEAASAMEGTKLLMLHNIEDDNVHFQNSVQMAAALENAGKVFDMVVYPGRMHDVTGPPAQQMLMEIAKFFEDSLK
jgi:dipeptidyl-peptidase 4